VLFSNDNGKTWQLMHDFQHPVVWVALDPSNNTRAYASVVHSSQGGIYVSSNIQNGATSTWTKLASPSRTQGHPFNITILNDGTVVASFSGRRAGSPLNFTSSSGVFTSTNAGSSWQDRSSQKMLYWTKDVVIDPSDPAQNTWYACVFSGWGGAANGLGGLYKTSNRGLSWSTLLQQDRIGSCSVNPTNPDEMYVTTEAEGLWYSTNLKSATPTFVNVASFPFRRTERLFFDPYNPENVWVTTFGNGMKHGINFIPVELASFTATDAQTHVSLEWRTATELNNAGFEIQRQYRDESLSAGSWETLGFVLGHGSTTEMRSYEYSDIPNPEAATIAYRLKQFDIDGSVTVSPEVVITRKGILNEFSISTHPNPFSQSIKISFSNPGGKNVTLRVLNALGQVLKEFSQRHSYEVDESFEWEPGDNAPGMYFLQALTDGAFSFKPIIYLP